MTSDQVLHFHEMTKLLAPIPTMADVSPQDASQNKVEREAVRVTSVSAVSSFTGTGDSFSDINFDIRDVIKVHCLFINQAT
jgi:hypothetical protein